MQILIVDDEAPARQMLRNLIDELAGGWCVVGEAASGAEALREVQKGSVDVVLMDIRMPVMDGLEAARYLAQMELPPAVIFTTAYDQHALEAFEGNAVDYLLKPVRAARLQQALTRAKRLNRAQSQVFADLGADEGQARSHVCAHYRGGMHLIPIEEVLFFRADNKYVAARHRGGELLLEDSLKTLEQEFAGQFLRIHRNALVAKVHVSGLEKDSLGRTLVRVG